MWAAAVLEYTRDPRHPVAHARRARARATAGPRARDRAEVFGGPMADASQKPPPSTMIAKLLAAQWAEFKVGAMRDELVELNDAMPPKLKPPKDDQVETGVLEAVTNVFDFCKGLIGNENMKIEREPPTEANGMTEKPLGGVLTK